ncbi:hypothetical protein O3M35_009045 [Rhynocoris fuscipes]|uniref:Uncharacterized protein n=1 Tax=Rhynocoris fuscipes TaxID=488301 RepID=A0AAW1D943_9HEMI
MYFKLFIITIFCYTTVYTKVYSDDNIDLILDEVLYSAEEYLKDNDLETINIPDVDVKYDNVVIDGSTINGYITAKTGTLTKSTSLKRSDPGTIDLIGEDEMDISLNVTFTSLKIHYDSFKFALWIGSNDGGADIDVTDNKFHVKIVFKYTDDSCSVTVDQANTVSLSGYTMSLLPPSVGNYIKNKIYTAYLNGHPGIGRYAVDSVLKDGLQKAADYLDICSFLKPNLEVLKQYMNTKH